MNPSQPENAPTLPNHAALSPKPEPVSPQHPAAFGQEFLPDLAMADFLEGQWQPLQCLPFATAEALPHSPAWSALHYGQCAFEGLKAHPSSQGLRLFRPYAHYLRLQSTCARLAMACPPWELFLAGLMAVLRRAPTDEAVYLRPLVASREAFLGVRPAREYRYWVMACPARPYFKPQGLRLRTEMEMARAFPGGTGDVKTPGNYAASLLASSRAKAEGFDDILWLDAATHSYAEEAGAMNVFFRLGNVWVTPALNGSILPGITRNTVLRLMRGLGMTVMERRVSVAELTAAAESGCICEAFGCGTAAGIAPIASISHAGQTIFTSMPSVSSAPLTQVPLAPAANPAASHGSGLDSTQSDGVICADGKEDLFSSRAGQQTQSIESALRDLFLRGRAAEKELEIAWDHPLDGWVELTPQ